MSKPVRDVFSHRSRKRLAEVSLLAHPAHTSSFVSPHTEPQLESLALCPTRPVPRRKWPPWAGSVPFEHLRHLIFKVNRPLSRPSRQPSGPSLQTDIIVSIQAASQRCQVRFTCWMPLFDSTRQKSVCAALELGKTLAEAYTDSPKPQKRGRSQIPNSGAAHTTTSFALTTSIFLHRLNGFANASRLLIQAKLTVGPLCNITLP